MDVQISDNAASSFSAASSAIGFIQPPQQTSGSFAPPLPPDSDAPLAAQPPLVAVQVPSTSSTGSKPIRVDSSLAETAAKVFHAPQPLNVEFYSTRNNEIVTILRDPSTGQVFAEFPADAVVRLAEFFQHLAGFVVDQKA